MPKVPEFLLRALYVKGSLRNRPDGFEFQMRNDLGPVRIIGARPLQIDRRPLPLDACRFVHGDREAGFAEVTPERSLLMRRGEAVTVQVRGAPLNRARHVVGINVLVKDVGPVSFTVTDDVA